MKPLILVLFFFSTQISVATSNWSSKFACSVVDLTAVDFNQNEFSTENATQVFRRVFDNINKVLSEFGISLEFKPSGVIAKSLKIQVSPIEEQTVILNKPGEPDRVLGNIMPEAEHLRSLKAPLTVHNEVVELLESARVPYPTVKESESQAVVLISNRFYRIDSPEEFKASFVSYQPNTKVLGIPVAYWRGENRIYLLKHPVDKQFYVIEGNGETFVQDNRSHLRVTTVNGDVYSFKLDYFWGYTEKSIE